MSGQLACAKWRGTLGASAQEGIRPMTATRETIEVTAGEVADELKRRGIGSDEKVTLTIEAGNESFPAVGHRVRASSRRG